MYVLCKCPPPCHFTLSFICTVRICTYIRTLLNLLGSPVASLILSRKCRGFPMSSVGSSTNTSLSTRSEPSCKQGSASTVSWPTSLPLKLVRGRRSWTSICRQRDTHHTLIHTNTHTRRVCNWMSTIAFEKCRNEQLSQHITELHRYSRSFSVPRNV